jgi:hypothetical protein
MRRKKQLLALSALFFALFLGVLFLGVQSVEAAGTLATGTPPPALEPTPTPEPDGTSGGDTSTTVTTVTNIFHHLLFPAETISEALGKVFMDAADSQSHQLVEQYATWYQAIGEIIQAPSAGDYARVAQSSWPVAAALAPALFILRIALYNWNRLVGEEDSALKAAGDILTALILAVLCGWFLDLIVRLGWWMTGAAIGEAGDMAINFVKAYSVQGVIENVASIGAFGSFLGIMIIAVELGAILALAGMLLAFAAANAGLFLLSVLGPSIAVASVLPQMRWLRSLWLKALTVIAILPLVAGGIFKASTYMTNVFTPGGILALFIRLMWLWGATGAMLSLAGILGKFTISTTTDAINQLVNAVKGVVTTAALAATGVGAVGAAGGLAGGAAGGAGGAAGGAAAAAGAAPTLPGGGIPGGGLSAGGGAESGGAALANAGSHLGAAQTWSNRSAMLEAFGLHRPAQFARALSNSHNIAAHQAELSQRMDELVGKGRGGSGGQGKLPKNNDDVGFPVSASVRKQLLDGFGGSAAKFRESYEEMRPMLAQHSLDPEVFASGGDPRKVGSMAKIYSSEKESLGQFPDQLAELARRAGYDLKWLEE